MDLALVLVAFLAGFAATQFRLPPLVDDFWATDFILHAANYEPTQVALLTFAGRGEQAMTEEAEGDFALLGEGSNEWVTPLHAT